MCALTSSPRGGQTLFVLLFLPRWILTAAAPASDGADDQDKLERLTSLYTEDQHISMEELHS